MSRAVAGPPEGASSNVQEGISQEDGIHQQQTDFQDASTTLLGAKPRIRAGEGSLNELPRQAVDDLGA